jgi:hypothetical protein
MKTEPHAENLQSKILTPRYIALGLLAGLLLVLGLTGCSCGPRAASDAGSGGTTNIAGAYTLVSVDGKAVPCVIAHEGTDITVKSGVMSINADGTCRSQSVFSLPQGRDVNRVVEATYTLSGTELTMRWKGAGMTRGTITGRDFTMINEGLIFAYRK